MPEIPELILVLAAAIFLVLVGTWLMGMLYHYRDDMAHDARKTAMKYLSYLAASIVGAYKLKEVVDTAIEAIR